MTAGKAVSLHTMRVCLLPIFDIYLSIYSQVRTVSEGGRGRVRQLGGGRLGGLPENGSHTQISCVDAKRSA